MPPDSTSREPSRNHAIHFSSVSSPQSNRNSVRVTDDFRFVALSSFPTKLGWNPASRHPSSFPSASCPPLT